MRLRRTGVGQSVPTLSQPIPASFETKPIASFLKQLKTCIIFQLNKRLIDFGTTGQECHFRTYVDFYIRITIMNNLVICKYVREKQGRDFYSKFYM